ncbi:hypothetical protein C8F01DRAFT_1146701, partial [Mycena amicta]
MSPPSPPFCGQSGHPLRPFSLTQAVSCTLSSARNPHRCAPAPGSSLNTPPSTLLKCSQLRQRCPIPSSLILSTPPIPLTLPTLPFPSAPPQILKADSQQAPQNLFLRDVISLEVCACPVSRPGLKNHLRFSLLQAPPSAFISGYVLCRCGFNADIFQWML